MKRTDNLVMAATKTKAKAASKHRPNGLIAELRSAAPEADKEFIARASKQAKRDLKNASKLGVSVATSLSKKMINKILASS